MTEPRYTLPSPVGNLLSLLPSYPGSFLFATGLNLALSRSLPLDVQQRLSGKRLKIMVTDAQLAFDFEWRSGKFCARANGGEADLTIGASAHDFLLLAQRQEDPDTLFFSRRLTMEGDTELGLLVKNTLDSIESPAVAQGALGAFGALRTLRAFGARRSPTRAE